jgi:hypothetical protein
VAIFLAVGTLRAAIYLFRIPMSANDAEGQQRRAATLYQPGDLMPVDAAGVHFGQRRRDAEIPV